MATLLLFHDKLKKKMCLSDRLNKTLRLFFDSFFILTLLLK